MKAFFTALLCGAFLAATPSSAVSRIGGGNGGKVVSPRTGFSADLSPAFYRALEGDNGLLLLQAPPAVTGKGPQDQILLAQDFDLQYPGLALADLDVVKTELATRGFSPTNPAADPCLKTWLKVSPESDVLVMAWGPGQGIVFTGTQTALVRQTLINILRTARIPTGACVWN